MSDQDAVPDSMIARARRLRKEMTEVEKKRWYRLRRLQLGVRFRRQVPIGSYIVDFASHDPKLNIELDGGQHSEQIEYDEERSNWLASRGFEVLRYWNCQVNQELDGVVGTIERRIKELSGETCS